MTALTLCFKGKQIMTLKCFESGNYFTFLFINLALAAYLHTDRHKQGNIFFFMKIVFAALVTDSFGD